MAEFHELVRAESIRLLASPEDVPGGGTLVARADAVAPVIGVCKAAARPADDGGLNAPQRLGGVLSNALDVGNGGVRSHPHAVVDARAQVLGEVAQDVAVQLSRWLVQDHGQAGAGRSGRARRGNRRLTQQVRRRADSFRSQCRHARFFQKSASVHKLSLLPVNVCKRLHFEVRKAYGWPGSVSRGIQISIELRAGLAFDRKRDTLHGRLLLL